MKGPSGIALVDLRWVVETANATLRLGGADADRLVTATAPVESVVGTRQHLRQIGRSPGTFGPARSPWQIEESTHLSIWRDHLLYRPERILQVLELAGLGRTLPWNRDAPKPPPACEGCKAWRKEPPQIATAYAAEAWAQHLWDHVLPWNLLYAAGIARLKYRTIPAPLPTDPRPAARYWQRWYNTTPGAVELRRAYRIFGDVWRAWDG